MSVLRAASFCIVLHSVLDDNLLIQSPNGLLSCLQAFASTNNVSRRTLWGIPC